MEKLISIVGQTSSGKSDLGIAIAREFDGEIVSADSRQVYKGLDFCSGKVNAEEQAQAVHHLIDVCELGTQFTLYDYQKMAYEKIDDIISRGKLPILVGGTGLYSRAVVEGYNLAEVKPDETNRKNLEKYSKEELIKICEEKGIQLPEETTARRIIRLLENENIEKKNNNPKYDVLQIGIYWDREEIYERIRIRLERRMPKMIEEIKSLLESGVSKDFLISLGLEAKYVVKLIQGEFESYDIFFEELFKEERHFAKRQKTWYNKEKNLVWLDAKDNLIEKAKKLVEEFLN